MIQQLKCENKKKKITELPRASNPYAEIIKIVYFYSYKKRENFK